MVTMPTISMSSPPSSLGIGEIQTRLRSLSERPKDCGLKLPSASVSSLSSGETGKPYTWFLVMTRKATGWMGIIVPGGRTGRCTPFWPLLSMKVVKSE